MTTYFSTFLNIHSSFARLFLTDLYFCRNEGSLVSALKTLLFFTILMVTLPIGLYFTSKTYVFEGKFP